ncbi:MAG: N5-glutamine methyltransferase family protein [Bacteriovoracaceae bacterium]
MLRWETELKLFWEKHLFQLEKSYPGINFERLIQVVKDLFPLQFQSHLLPLNPLYQQWLEAVPLEYMTGEKYFYRSVFTVNEKVLIPRSETEILVDMASQFLKKNPEKKKIIDIGTGSGAIILSLLMDQMHPLEAYATDLSCAALEVARTNYQRHLYQIHAKSSLKFLYADRLFGIQDQFDLIVTNPPYIHAEKDRQKVHQQTYQYEPHSALYIPDSEYESWFKIFLLQIQSALRPGGLCLMEGHEDHLENLQSLALTMGFGTVNIVKDYAQNNRFLEIKN